MLDCNSITVIFVYIIIMRSDSLLVVSFLVGSVAAFQPSISNFGVNNQRSISALEMGFGNEYIPSGFTKAR